MANVRVAVRVRPLNDKEVDAGAHSIITTHGNSLSIKNVKVEGLSEYGDSRDRLKHFTFDYCYDSASERNTSNDYASQELVYQDLGTEILQAAFDGYNTCLFAYGQTGTGKTYTMMGYPGEVGLTPRICEGLFSHVDDNPEENITFRVEISYMEIYNERVRDLLQPSGPREKYTLRVREHPKEGPYVHDLSRHVVHDFHEIQTLLDRGNQLRTTAATHMHEHSSRSHAIVTVNFTQAKMESGLPSEIVSKVHLVDLAGSERADPSYHAEYKGRITEGANINKSLVTLGNVIKALAETSLLTWSSETISSNQTFAGAADGQLGLPLAGLRKSRPPYIPYRDSVLTWLLKDSLGGNSKTLMIATVTPAGNYYNETISTLRYAQRAKSIINKPRINEDANVALIRQLRQEIEKLKQMLASARMHGPQHVSELLCLLPHMERFLNYSSDAEDEAGASLPEQNSGDIITEKLKENEAMANHLTQTWLDKWSEAHSLIKDSDLSIRGLQGRRSSSYGIIIDSQLPHLIGMDEDILSTGVIIFHLKEGKTLIGREDARQEQDIVLDGTGIHAEHCFITNEHGEVTLHPRHGAPCKVNGIVVFKPTILTQGDVLIFGNTNTYRFNNPAQAAKLRQHRKHKWGGSLQDGELSSASSMISLSDTEVTRVAPLRMFNPKLASAQICLELEHTYATEAERIRQARKELARLHAEVTDRDEARQEEEEQLWAEHERHRQELEAEKIRLECLVERLHTQENEAQESLQKQRELLDQEAALYKEQLRYELEQVSKSQGTQSEATCQTDTLHHSVKGSQADGTAYVVSAAESGAVAISGPVGQEIRKRKLSLEGRVKGLAHQELLHTLGFKQAERDLKIQEEEMEKELFQKRNEIESRWVQICEKEEMYHDVDTTRLAHILQEKDQLEELQRQEEQLELYLEEKQDLMAVVKACPQPLRGASSEQTLTFADDDMQNSFRPTRAASEAALDEKYTVYDAAASDYAVSDSRESFYNAIGILHSYGHDSNTLSYSTDSFEAFQVCEVLSQSCDSEIDKVEVSSPTSEVDVNLPLTQERHSVRPQTLVEGRGRGRSRVPRGRTHPVQGQGQEKLESSLKKLTSTAAEVTARLYKSRSPRPDLEGNYLRSKHDRGVEASSYSPPSRKAVSPPVFHKSLSPQPKQSMRKRTSNAFASSTVKETRSGVSQCSVEEPNSRSEQDIYGPLNKGSSDGGSMKHSPGGQKKPSTDTLLKTNVRKNTKGQSDQLSQRAVKGRRSDTVIEATSDLRSQIKTSQKRTDKGSKDGSIKSQISRSETLSSQTGDSKARHQGSELILRGLSDRMITGGAKQSPWFSESSQLQRRPYSRSDSNLIPSQMNSQSHLRPRSRLRQIVSALSLPSVPEAAAEVEAELDQVPLISGPEMAALVAAVPRRKHRGRYIMEDERRHSEPVGDRLADAFEQYTTDIENSKSQEDVHQADRISNTFLNWSTYLAQPSLTGSETISKEPSEITIPDVMLTEESSSNMGVISSSEQLFNPLYPEDAAFALEPHSAFPETVVTIEKDHTEDLNEAQEVTNVFQEEFHYYDSSPKAGTKREHGSEQKGEEQVETAVKKKRDQNQWSQSTEHELHSVVYGTLTADHPNVPCTPQTPPNDNGIKRIRKGSIGEEILPGASGCSFVDEGTKDKSCEGHFFTDTLSLGDRNEELRDRVKSDQVLITKMLEHDDSDLWQRNDSREPEENFSSDSLDEGDMSELLEGTNSLFTDTPSGLSKIESVGIVLPDNQTFLFSILPQEDALTRSTSGASNAQCFSNVHDSCKRSDNCDLQIENFVVVPQDQLVSCGMMPSLKLSESFPSDRQHQEQHKVADVSISVPQSQQSIGDSFSSTTPSTDERHVTKMPDCEDHAILTINADTVNLMTSQIQNEVPIQLSQSAGFQCVTGSMLSDMLVLQEDEDNESELHVTRDITSGTCPSGIAVSMLTLSEDEEGSQLSDETSASNIEKQLHLWQEVLQQLSPRQPDGVHGTRCTNGHNVLHASNSRRNKRRQHSRQLKGSDSENAEYFSDDSLVSGANSRSSSRPSSGSRRRRRPVVKSLDVAVKKRRGQSSEEYVTSDNDSIFSDDSLTQSSGHQDASVSHISSITSCIQHLTEELTADDEAALPKSRTRNDFLFQTDRLTGAVVEGPCFEITSLENIATMAEQQLSVPELVSYFESEAAGKSSTDKAYCKKTKKGNSSSSSTDEDGGELTSEGTQTCGSSLLMGRGPLSLWSGGDKHADTSDRVHDAMHGQQAIVESSFVSSHARRSWNLSITPTIIWDSSIQQGEDETDTGYRKSKSQKSETDLEKQLQQNKLTDLHSKYGLFGEEEQLSDEENDFSFSESWDANSKPLHAVQDFQSSLQRKMHKEVTDQEGRVRFEVTINQDETNILYNVEKTEYKTYCLRDSFDGSVDETAREIPNTINVNLTETTVQRRENHFETITKSQVVFDGASGGASDAVYTESKHEESHSLEYDLEKENGNISRESSVERHLTDEDSDSYLKFKDSVMDSQAVVQNKDSLDKNSVSVGSDSDSSAYHQKPNTHLFQSSEKKEYVTEVGDVCDSPWTTRSPLECEMHIDTANDQQHGKSLLGVQPLVQCSVPGKVHKCDSEVPVESFVPQTSISRTVSSVKDGEYGTSYDALLQENQYSTISPAPVADVAQKLHLQREDIVNSLYRGRGGVMATQLHQTISMHQDRPKQNTSFGISDHSPQLYELQEKQDPEEIGISSESSHNRLASRDTIISEGILQTKSGVIIPLSVVHSTETRHSPVTVSTTDHSVQAENNIDSLYDSDDMMTGKSTDHTDDRDEIQVEMDTHHFDDNDNDSCKIGTGKHTDPSEDSSRMPSRKDKEYSDDCANYQSEKSTDHSDDKGSPEIHTEKHTDHSDNSLQFQTENGTAYCNDSGEIHIKKSMDFSNDGSYSQMEKYKDLPDCSGDFKEEMSTDYFDNSGKPQPTKSIDHIDTDKLQPQEYGSGDCGETLAVKNKDHSDDSDEILETESTDHLGEHGDLQPEMTTDCFSNRDQFQPEKNSQQHNDSDENEPDKYTSCSDDTGDFQAEKNVDRFNYGSKFYTMKSRDFSDDFIEHKKREKYKLF